MNNKLGYIINTKTLAFSLIGIVIFIVFFAKPLRIAVPTILGLHCFDFVCVEQRDDYLYVKAVYKKALHEVNIKVKKIIQRPKFIFCKSDACYKKFGGGNERAISFPYLGTILASDSWQIYIVKHELIHWLQFQELGSIQTMLKPIWYREGMAYTLSEAPLDDVPAEHIPFMLQYQAWERERNKNDIWIDAPRH